MARQDPSWMADAYSDRPHRHRRRRTNHSSPLRIVLIGFVLGLFGVVAVMALRYWFMLRALEQLQTTTMQSVGRIQEQSASILRAQQLKQQQAQQLRAQQEQERLTAIAQAERANEIVMRRQAEEAQVRKAAWDRFYRKPSHCDAAQEPSAVVECGNHFARAKKAFDAQYVTAR